jgi:hypothetical protein
MRTPLNASIEPMPSPSPDPGPLVNARMLDLPGNPQPLRQVTVVELDERAPFPVRRIYWIHAVEEGEMRGYHAHRTTQQLIVATSGAFEIVLDDGHARRTFVLDDPTRALWVPGGLWRVIRTLATGSVLLVLASAPFSEDEYIRDYDQFLAYARDRASTPAD